MTELLETVPATGGDRPQAEVIRRRRRSASAGCSSCWARGPSLAWPARHGPVREVWAVPAAQPAVRRYAARGHYFRVDAGRPGRRLRRSRPLAELIGAHVFAGDRVVRRRHDGAGIQHQTRKRAWVRCATTRSPAARPRCSSTRAIAPPTSRMAQTMPGSRCRPTPTPSTPGCTRLAASLGRSPKPLLGARSAQALEAADVTAKAQRKLAVIAPPRRGGQGIDGLDIEREITCCRRRARGRAGEQVAAVAVETWMRQSASGSRAM